MSDTPRTDAEVERVKRQCRGEYHLEGGDFVNTEFARQLERELAAHTVSSAKSA